jgi:hypothetical protein
MKTKCLKIFYLGITFVCVAILNSEQSYAQTMDTLTNSSFSNGAFQFQIIGGIGIYYIADLSTDSHLRIGADVNLNHSDQSEDRSGYSIYTSGSPSSSNLTTTTSQPEQASNSYQIIFSTLYLQKIAEYKHINLYCGVGPMLSYSWNRSTTKSGSTSTYSSGINSYVYTDENTSNSRNLGALTILGVNSQILDHVGLTAEIGLSASYNWKTYTSSYSSSNTGTSSSPNSNVNSDVSHIRGWSVEINAIRIGIIIGI